MYSLRGSILLRKRGGGKKLSIFRWYSLRGSVLLRKRGGGRKMSIFRWYFRRDNWLGNLLYNGFRRLNKNIWDCWNWMRFRRGLLEVLRRRAGRREERMRTEESKRDFKWIELTKVQVHN
ncbi:hypothetical protein Taro_005800 [Colocasia esculenta]|uniref:Uncharacterized protein n=1 Tax=Colocasia esculenta TaxID=4460 RepID=A0A843TLZ7_COLES|nr:hypothetical protein [Colocasia esculenta]